MTDKWTTLRSEMLRHTDLGFTSRRSDAMDEANQAKSRAAKSSMCYYLHIKSALADEMVHCCANQLQLPPAAAASLAQFSSVSNPACTHEKLSEPTGNTQFT
jgi:hypothetical protein